MRRYDSSFLMTLNSGRIPEDYEKSCFFIGSGDRFLSLFRLLEYLTSRYPGDGGGGGGGDCVFNSWTTSAQWWFQSEYIWVNYRPDKQGIKAYKPTDSLKDWRLTILIFLGVLRPTWPIGLKVSNSIRYWWLQYSPRETWWQELPGFLPTTSLFCSWTCTG